MKKNIPEKKSVISNKTKIIHKTKNSPVKKDGLELAIRFSFITNKLQYCGPGSAQHVFLYYLEHKDNADDVREAFSRFEGLWSYLTSIAEKHKKDPLDYDVVEAYWIGNSLLDSFSREDNANIIRKLTARGLPKSIGEACIKKLPEGFVPHHNFNVFYVGVGKTTGSVPTNLQNMDNCRTSWGTVIEVRPELLVVKTNVLVIHGKKYSLGDEDVKIAHYIPQMLHDVKTGDVVALHWGCAGYVLQKSQLEQLKRYTQKILEVMNR
jgi:hypothetical protein